MIKLFISDIDGCLSEPYRPFDRRRLEELATYAAAAAMYEDGPLPAFSLCSGRAYPYVEAMTQTLGLRMPVLFESGGGCFDPVTARVVWHPAFTPAVEDAVGQVRRWMLRECVPGSSLMYDYSKRTQAGVSSADSDEIAAYVSRVEAFVARQTPDLCVYHTPISIDVLAATITKKQGLRWLGERLTCSMDQMAYIGDTHGDLGALDAVGFSFAPANASDEVREKVQVVTEGAVAEGVLEAYRWCVAWNENHLKKAS